MLNFGRRARHWKRVIRNSTDKAFNSCLRISVWLSVQRFDTILHWILRRFCRNMNTHTQASRSCCCWPLDELQIDIECMLLFNIHYSSVGFVSFRVCTLTSQKPLTVNWPRRDSTLDSALSRAEGCLRAWLCMNLINLHLSNLYCNTEKPCNRLQTTQLDSKIHLWNMDEVRDFAYIDFI